MALNGFLSEFSLGEVFQLIEKGEKTGLLSIRELTLTTNLLSCDITTSSQKYYLWFKNGRIIAAANRLDHKGLPTLIQKRGWLKDAIDRELAKCWDGTTSLGICLKSQGMLDSHQLKLLFITQVMQQVCNLFKLDKGYFQFERNSKPPKAEMTGLSKPATELTLTGLRMLKNWTPLAEKLPQPTSGLISLIDNQPSHSLNHQEWQVWEYTKGTTALKNIAKELQLPIEKVQQIAFRLIVIGLAEELPMVEMVSPAPETLQLEEEANTTPTISHSFLNHLTSFLQNKTS
jgi:hypothetical protein